MMTLQRYLEEINKGNLGRVLIWTLQDSYIKSWHVDYSAMNSGRDYHQFSMLNVLNWAVIEVCVS